LTISAANAIRIGDRTHQDFGAKAVFDNLNALAACVATQACLDPDSPYKINRTQAIDKIKRQLGRGLLGVAVTARRIKPVIEELALNLQKFVPHRARPRPHRPKPHLSHAYKTPESVRICHKSNTTH
jgi:hypothetical protein